MPNIPIKQLMTVVAGVIIAGYVLNLGKSMPVIKEAHKGFDS